MPHAYTKDQLKPTIRSAELELVIESGIKRSI